MKKNVITLVVSLLITASSFAQQGINYEALIKDNLGNVVSNQTIGVEFQIREASANGITVYTETHMVSTDVNGILVLNIGNGTTSDTFGAIDWSGNNHWLNVQIDITGGTNYIDMSTTQFMAVPYAIHATTASNAATKIDDLLDGKSVVDGSSLFIGVDAGMDDDGTENENLGIGKDALRLNTTGRFNTAIGKSSLGMNETGMHNSAFGYQALYSNTRGHHNTANGSRALILNTTGKSNTAMGSLALYSNKTGIGNTANGASALHNNVTGNYNTANGASALTSNTTGSYNTALGRYALLNNTIGIYNSSTGIYALHSNTKGNYNTANGSQALFGNKTGNSNTAVGTSALYSNTTGYYNTANGYRALYDNTIGFRNTAIGNTSLKKNVSGSYNVAIGENAMYNLTSGNNNIAIGAGTVVPDATGSYQVRIGNNQINYAGIQVPWTYTSDKRWKDNIRNLPYGLDMVMQLQPVDYIRKSNEKQTREMGFIAQDIEVLLAKVGYKDQGFLTKDDDGYLSVRYNDLIALLTKAIQEQQNIIDGQNAQIDTITADNSSLKTTVTNLILRVEKIEANNQ